MSAQIASTSKAGAPDALPSSAANPPTRDPPAGYSVINIDGRQHLVPRFRVPALQHVIAAERFYSELGVDQAAGGVSLTGPNDRTNANLIILALFPIATSNIK